MIERKVIIPLFKHSELSESKEESAALRDELIACVDDFEIRHGKKDLFLMLVRQSIGNDDYQYGLACCDIENVDDLFIQIPNAKIPLITVGIKNDISRILSKITKNLAFV